MNKKYLDEKGKFAPGNPGGGRPKGARNKLGELLLEALKEDFEAHGVEAIQTMRADKPAEYVKALVSILPKEMNANINANLVEFLATFERGAGTEDADQMGEPAGNVCL